LGTLKGSLRPFIDIKNSIFQYYTKSKNLVDEYLHILSDYLIISNRINMYY